MQDRDYDGQADDAWAEEALNNYRTNNDSIIDDHFQVLPHSDACSLSSPLPWNNVQHCLPAPEVTSSLRFWPSGQCPFAFTTCSVLHKLTAINVVQAKQTLTADCNRACIKARSSAPTASSNASNLITWCATTVWEASPHPGSCYSCRLLCSTRGWATAQLGFLPLSCVPSNRVIANSLTGL